MVGQAGKLRKVGVSSRASKLGLTVKERFALANKICRLRASEERKVIAEKRRIVRGNTFISNSDPLRANQKASRGFVLANLREGNPRYSILPKTSDPLARTVNHANNLKGAKDIALFKLDEIKKIKPQLPK